MTWFFFLIVLEGLLGPGNMWSYRLGKDRVKTRRGYRKPRLERHIDVAWLCCGYAATNFPVLSSFQRQQPELCCIGTLPFSSRPPVPCYSFFGSGRCIQYTCTIGPDPLTHTQPTQRYLSGSLGLSLLHYCIIIPSADYGSRVHR